MEDYRELLVKNCKTDKGFYHKNKILSFFKKFPEIEKEVLEFTSFSEGISTIKERVYFYVERVVSFPKCICGNNITNMRAGTFQKACSNKCSGKYTHNKVIEKYGSTDIFQTNARKTLKEKYGVDNPMKIKEVQEKAIKTKRSQYGVNFEQIVKKVKNTKLERYGDETFNNIERIKQTNLERYGCTTFLNSIEGQKVSKQSKLERYGCEWYNNPDKIRKTVMERYGVVNARLLSNMNPKLQFNKTNKVFEFPSGKKEIVQGYEPFALTELLNKFSEDEIKVGMSKVPYFQYEYEGVVHIYYPDIYIEKTNTIIEVKSEFTMLYEFQKNLSKFKAVKDEGFNFELMVFDREGNRL